jgi:tripartite-type tricarboxylate transporter receptor subunit TctC
LDSKKFWQTTAAVAFAALLLILELSSIASQSAYPSRQIRAIVPYSAGSGADITARQTMASLSGVLNQNIVVENRPGTSAIVGTDAVAKAAPDGYTLLFGVTQHAINPGLHSKLPYDTMADFTAVGRVTSQPLFLAVSSTLPVNSVIELVQYIKERPGKLNYASTGVGTSIHLAGAYFAYKTGLEMSHVPYVNASQTMIDLGRGDVQVIFYTYQPLVAQLQAGRIKILGSTGATRSSWAPDVPTMAEAGIADFVMPAWHGVFVPSKTPNEVVTVLQKALANVTADPNYKKALEPTGTDVYYASSQDFTAFVRSEMDRFREILQISGTKLN